MLGPAPCPGEGNRTAGSPTFQQVRERGATVTRDRVVALANVLEELIDVVTLERVQARGDVVAAAQRGETCSAVSCRPAPRCPPRLNAQGPALPSAAGIPWGEEKVLELGSGGRN